MFGWRSFSNREREELTEEEKNEIFCESSRPIMEPSAFSEPNL